MQKQCKARAEQKGKPKNLLFAMPSRSLFYVKAGKSDTNMSALACLQMSG